MEKKWLKGKNLERRVRIKKGFLDITATKREREGPRASRAYPTPAATVIAACSFASCSRTG